VNVGTIRGVVRAARALLAAKEFTMTDDYWDVEAALLRQDHPGRPAALWGLLELGWLADSLATFVGDSRGRAEEHSMQLRVLGAAVKSYCDELRCAVATGVEPKVAA
jgi:hypothetical protein